MYKFLAASLLCGSLSAAYYDDKSHADQLTQPQEPPLFRPPPLIAPLSLENNVPSRRVDLGDIKVQLYAETIFFRENLCNKEVKTCESESYFNGIRVGLERFKKSSVYGRINWMVVPDQRHRYFETHDLVQIEGMRIAYKVKEKLAFGHVDAELGYAFKIAGAEKYTFTPFIGTGRYHFIFKTSAQMQSQYLEKPMVYSGYRTTYERDDWPYYAFGARVDYWGEIFSIGLKYKQMRAYRVESILPATRESQRMVMRNPDFSSFEVSVPMSMKFGKESKWSMSYEPYFVKFGSSNVPQMVGNRISIDFRF